MGYLAIEEDQKPQETTVIIRSTLETQPVKYIDGLAVAYGAKGEISDFH